MMHTVRACTMGLASLIIAGYGATAPAQQRENEITSIMLDEIVVTARRKEESAQDVPVAVTAITADKLVTRSALLLSDIAKETPSLTIQSRFSDRNTQIVSLRGQVQTDAQAAVDPSVGVYLNDIYVARNNGANFELFDIDRVEVLAGPQGTLYGRNTTGGAIKLVTRGANPDDELGGYVLVNGSNYQGRRVEGALNVPFSNKLAVRLAGLGLERDGYGKLIVGDLQPMIGDNGQPVFDSSAPFFTPRKTFDTDNKDIKAGRLSVTFEPTDKLGFSLVGDYSKQASNGATGYQVGNTFVSSAPGTSMGLQGNPKPYGNFTKCSSDFYTACQDSSPSSRAEVFGVGLTTTYDVAVGTAKLIYGYRDVDASFTSDLEGTPIPFETTSQPSEADQNSVELQFQGQTKSLDYTVGLYYFKEEASEGFSDASSVVDTVTLNRVLNQELDNESKSIYGQIGYALTKSLRLTLGGRYTEDDKGLESVAILLPNANQPTGLCLFSGSGTLTPAMLSPSPTVNNCRFSKDDTFNNFSWTVGLDWQIRDNLLAYIKSSEGYRSGGQNLRGINALTQRPYKEETIRDYELGLKSRLFDERVQLNLTYYHSDYKDIQTTIFQFFPAPQNTTTFLTNQGNADIDGVELTSTIIATKNLSFDLTGSYINFAFDQRQFVPPLTPRLKGSAAVNLLFPTNFGDWSTRVSYSYQDEFFPSNRRSEVVNVPEATIGSRGLLDARLTVNLKAYDVSISAFGTNLTDKEYFESGTLFSVGTLNVFNRLQVGQPRIYGLEISKQF